MFSIKNIRDIPLWQIRAVMARQYEGIFKPHWYEPLKEFMASFEYQEYRARAYIKTKRSRIRSFIRRGKLRDAVHLAHLLHNSRGARLVAAADAIRAEKRLRTKLERKYGRKFTKELPTASFLADLLSDANVDPIVKTWRQAKQSGGFRTMVKFDLVDRARQHLVKLSFGALVTYDPSQHGVGRKAAPHALALAESLFRDLRMNWVCELDLRSFFDRLPVATIAERYRLPLHIVKNVLTLEGKEERKRVRSPQASRALPDNDDLKDPTDITTRRSLPMGSSISPIFAYGILAPALKTFRDEWGDRVGLANCNDNFLLLAPDRETLTSAINSLRVLVRDLAAAELTLANKSGVRKVEDGINFLGQRLCRSPGREVRTMSREKKIELNRLRSEKISELENASAEVLPTLFEKILRWTIAALSAHKHAVGDYHRMAVKYLQAFQKFAIKNRMRNRSWYNFIATLQLTAPRHEVRQANIWPGVKIRSLNGPTDVPRNFKPKRVESALIERLRPSDEIDKLMVSIKSSLAGKYGLHSSQVQSISRHSALKLSDKSIYAGIT